MWIRIRAVIIEDEPLAAQYLAALLDDTCQVEVVGSATESEVGLRLCAELRPDAVFVDINLPGKDGVSLATQLVMLPQPPRLVFTTGNANRATDAFRLQHPRSLVCAARRRAFTSPSQSPAQYPGLHRCTWLQSRAGAHPDASSG